MLTVPLAHVLLVYNIQNIPSRVFQSFLLDSWIGKAAIVFCSVFEFSHSFLLSFMIAELRLLDRFPKFFLELLSERNDSFCFFYLIRYLVLLSY